MKVYRFSGLARRLLFAALCASALASSAGSALPQGGGSRGSAIRERNADTLRELEMRRRDGGVKTASPQQPQPHPALPYARSKEDFRTLQLVNNEIMREVFAAGAAGAPDYGRVAAAAAEINKRASRLKSNLRLPEPARKSPRSPEVNISNDKQLKTSLRTLDELIMGFVTNPAFRDPGTVDGHHSAVAAENLTRIVELSRAVRLSAEKMRKAREGFL